MHLKIEKNGTGIEKNGTGIEKHGTGIEKHGTGIEKHGTGIMAARLMSRTLLVLFCLVGAFSSVSAAELKGFVVKSQSGAAISIQFSDFQLIGAVDLENGYGIADLYAPIQGSGTGEKIQGSGTGAPIQGSGTGEKIQGSGTGEKIQGSGTGAPIQGSGTGGKIQGSGTGAPIQGSGTGERAMVIWGAAEISIEGDIAYVILYEMDRRGSFIETAALEIPVATGK